jgi:hypothetical protein
MRIWRVLEKVIAVLVVAPPVYMAFRYLRWYFRQHNETEKESE